ncbi:hypothetical protein ACLB2K_023219 [Fragaria x ananassa]
MWEDSCEEGKTLLTPTSISKLSLAFKNLIKDFPQELIHDVLIRLPIKPLVKCTSVCKSWRTIIKDPTFILTHLTHKRSFNTQNATHLLLLHTVFGEDLYHVLVKPHIEGFKEDLYSLHYDNSAFGEYCKIEFPIGLKQILVNQCFRMVASCNGLVCLSDDLELYAYSFVLWNPCVRKYVILPEPLVKYCSHGGYEATIGLGYDAVTNDFKVVRLATLIDVNERVYDCPTIAQVYSLAKGCWSRLRSDLPPCQICGCSSQAFVNGVLHWLALRLTDGAYSYFVLTFDVGVESFREMMLPKNFKLDGSLALRLSVSGDKKSIALFASHGGYEATIGLGYDAVTNDFKVVRLATLIDVNERVYDCPTIAQVYSLAKGCWSRLRSDLPPCQICGCSSQAFVNGVLHWLALRLTDGAYSYFVLTFDVGVESFREMMLPKNFKLDGSLALRLSVSGDKKSIALFARCQSVTDSFLDIWLMGEYCVEKSWTKLMILTPQGPERSLPGALCFRKSGEVVLAREDDLELVSVDLVSKQFKSFGVAGGQLCAVLPYEESLVLLDSKDAASY